MYLQEEISKKNLEKKKIIFGGTYKATVEMRIRIHTWFSGTDPRIRIRIKTPRIRNTALQHFITKRWALSPLFILWPGAIYIATELIVIVLELLEELHPLSLELLLAELSLLHAVHAVGPLPLGGRGRGGLLLGGQGRGGGRSSLLLPIKYSIRSFSVP